MNIFKKKKPQAESPTVREVKKDAPAKRESFYHVIRPWISEKSTDLKEKGAYVFLVRKDAGKKEIEKEIEARYGVQTEGIRIIRKKGKQKRFGKFQGKREDVKKAIVKLKEGDTIDII